MLNIVLRIMMIWRTLLGTEWPGSDVEDANKEENKIFSRQKCGYICLAQPVL